MNKGIGSIKRWNSIIRIVMVSRNIEAILVKIRVVEVKFQSGAYRKLDWSVFPNKTNKSFTKYRGSEEQTSNFRG